MALKTCRKSSFHSKHTAYDTQLVCCVSHTEIISTCFNCFRVKESCQKYFLDVSYAWQVASSVLRRLQACAVCQLASSQVSLAWWRQMRGESELLLGVERSHFHLVSYTWAPHDDRAAQRAVALPVWVFVCTETPAHKCTNTQRVRVSSVCFIYE